MTDRPTLALLPGLLCDAALWQSQVAALAGLADCRVAELTAEETVAGMARSVLALMPDRFALAGLSMGGYVALEILRQAPERVTKLALLNTRATPDSAEETARRRDLVALAERGQFKGVTPRLLPLFLHEAHLADAAIVGTVRAMAERVGKDAFIRQQKAIMARPDSRPTLAAIRCPTLVLCGREDVLTPVEGHRAMAAGIRDARLEVIDDCGHLSPLEQPERVNVALVGWLEAT